MGNSIVIPSFQDWYAPTFKKIGFNDTKHLESGTFFMVFQGKISNNPAVVKAYEYTNEIQSLDEAQRSFEFFKRLEDYLVNLPGIIKYSDIYCDGTMAFLTREKFQTSLEDLLIFQEPPITNIEKEWIAYQICIVTLRLHQAGLYHSDLKPSNIFVQDSFFTYITDLAPYKPETISPNRMNLYYHFFTTSQTSGYYLAPERFTNENKKIDMQAADLFSLGCVLYFIYSDGKNLFDVMSGLKYGVGEDVVSEKLSKISDENIRNLIKDLISLDIDVRLKAETNMIRTFPEQMKILFDMFRSFLLNNDFDVTNDSEKLLDVSMLGEDKFKVITIDYLNDLIQRDVYLKNYEVFFNAYSKIAQAIPDDFKIVRCIPAVALIIEHVDAPILQQRVLHVILELLTDIHSVPREFRGIFASFLNPLLEKASSKNERTKEIIANFLPKYAAELERLAPSTFERIAIDFAYITTTDNIKVFTIFTDSLIQQSSKGFRLLNTFLFSLFSTFNFPDEAFKIRALKVFIAFYDTPSPNEVRLFYEQCNESILPVCQDLLSRNISNSLLLVILDVLEIAFSRGMADRSFGYAMLPKFADLSLNTEIEIRFKARRLASVFPRPMTAVALSDYDQISDAPGKVPRVVRKNLFQTQGLPVPAPKVYPFFCKSMRVDNSPINFIDAIDLSTFITIQGDTKVKYMSVQDNFADISVNRSKILRTKVTAMVTRETSLITGHENGEIYTIDHRLFQKTCIYQHNAMCKSLLTVSDNVFVGGFNDGTISVIDTREPSSAQTSSYTFQDITDITSLSPVHNCENVATIGFSEGVLAMFDARVMMPVWLSMSPPVKQVIHIDSPTSSCAFCVLTDDAAFVISEPVHQSLFSFPINNGVAAPFKGSAVVVSNNGAMMMHSSQCFDMYDNAIYPAGTFCHEAPLSLHAAKLNACCVHKTILVTGDEAGFLNFSVLGKKRRRSSNREQGSPN